MAIKEKMSGAQQENLISLLCHNDEHGKLIANLADATLFEGDYRIIAERALAYWRAHRQAPKTHTIDLVADIVEDPHDRRGPVFRQILIKMLHLSDTGINTQYVIEQLQLRIRGQALKAAVFRAAEELHRESDNSVAQVEEILHTVLKARTINFDSGRRLDDTAALLRYLEVQYSEFDTGVQVLDKRNIVPQRGTIMVLIAPKGSGKTWFLINAGKRALMRRKKVFHATIENSADETQMRYFQAMFGVPKRGNHNTEIPIFQRDSNKRVVAIESEKVDTDFTLISPTLKLELDTRHQLFGDRMENLIIKKFPPRSLTANGLEAYLDTLEQVEGFIPDLLLVDYAGIMKTDISNYRISLGNEFEGLRGIGVERNIPVLTALQSNREGAKSKMVQNTDVAESWATVHTADFVLTYSSTEEEHKRGLARLYVNNARTEEDKFGALITQNYYTGQFVLDSALLPKEYFNILRDMREEGDDDADSNE